MTFRILFDFKKFIDAVVITFSGQLITKMDGVAKYAPLQAQVDVVKLATDAFSAAVDAASNGGKNLVRDKNDRKKELRAELEKLALLTQVQANGDSAYALNAGFNVQEKPQRSTAPLPQPVLKYLRRGEKSGTIVGEIENMPKGAKELCLLHSIDSFTTSANGTNSSSKKFTIDLGITEQRVQVRGYFIGTFQRKSDLSDSMEIFVL